LENRKQETKRGYRASARNAKVGRRSPWLQGSAWEDRLQSAIAQQREEKTGEAVVGAALPFPAKHKSVMQSGEKQCSVITMTGLWKFRDILG